MIEPNPLPAFRNLDEVIDFLITNSKGFFGVTISNDKISFKNRFGWQNTSWSEETKWLEKYCSLVAVDCEALEWTESVEESFSWSHVSSETPFRFRTCLTFGMTHWDLVLRLLPNKVFPLSMVRLSDAVVDHFVHIDEGLVLVSGETGSGKSSTMASLIDHRLSQRSEKLYTAENPIEYLHTARPGCVVKQIEVGEGKSVPDYQEAIRRAMRQDPDIILLQELRTPVEAVAALDAALTGHVVVASLHASDPVTTIKRFVRWLEIYQGKNADTDSLGRALKLVISQRMHTFRDHFAPIHEVLLASEANANAVATQISNGRLSEMKNLIATGRSHGMVTFEHSRQELERELLRQQKKRSVG